MQGHRLLQKAQQSQHCFFGNYQKAFFFGKTISRKAGQKCCPYNQNGKPLPTEKVDEFLAGYGDKAFWRVDEDKTRLTRSYYLKNIFCATEFVKDVY